MVNKFIVNNIKVNLDGIFYEYTVEGEWKKYFNLNEDFFVKYSEDINQVPKSIAIIPLLVNVLPISWVHDAEIYVNEIDEDFLKSLPQVKQGYIEMYPEIEFKGSLLYNSKENNTFNDDVGKSGLLFSGGADAFHSLISHNKESPALITVWGADLDLEHYQGWELVKSYVSQTSDKWNLESYFIKSNFRKFINESELNNNLNTSVNTNWWVGFQYGIGLLGLAAPISFINNISLIYIASSYTARDKAIRRTVSSNDYTIVDELMFNNARIHHDGYTHDRQEKISEICEFSEKYNIDIPLRVCWESKEGSNCNRCEKCYRTILSILAERKDPRNYGFIYNDSSFPEMMKDFKNKTFVKEIFYIPIQKKLRKQYTIKEVGPELRWFYNVDVNKMNKNIGKYFYRIGRVLKRKLPFLA